MRHSQTDIVSRIKIPLVDGWPSVGYFNYDAIKSLEFGRFGSRSLNQHLFVDDWRFESCWRRPDFGTGLFSFGATLIAPDFSLFLDDPLPFAIYQMWRSRVISSQWSLNGRFSVPCIQFGSLSTLPFASIGILPGSVLAVRCPSSHSDIDYYSFAVKQIVQDVQCPLLLIFGSLRTDFKKNLSCDSKIFKLYPR